MKLLLSSFAALFLGLNTTFSSAFTPGNLVVSRAGSGASTLSSAAAPVFLDEFTPAGALVQTIPLPTAPAGGDARLTLAGSSTSEGFLSRSTDGRFLTLAGYDAAPAQASVASTTASTVNRVVAAIDATGLIDVSTRLADGFSGSNVRSAFTTDGAAFYVAGTSSPATSGGVRYVPAGNSAATATTQIAATPNNARVVASFGGELFLSSASGTNLGINKVGNGLPTGSGTSTALYIASASGSSSAYGFVLLDRDATVAGLDTAYVADSSAGLQKYSFDGTAWTFRGAVAQSGLSGLTGTISGGGVQLYGVAPGALVRFTDAAAFNAAPSGSFSTLATAASSTAFRGVAFAPVAAGGPTSPGGSGLASPNTVSLGGSTLLSVSVTPGTTPASTGLAVAANLSAIGGAAAQPFFDDATHGDATADDGIFSFTMTVNAGTGPLSLPVEISDAETRTASASIALTVTTASGLTLIHTIQGQTDTSLTGAYKIAGVVTALYPAIGGFFVEEEESDWDADPLTSEGIFVNSTTAVQIGQKVQVQGTVANDFGLTQFSAGASVAVLDGGVLSSLPQALTPALPVPSALGGTPYLERFEGMRVVFPGLLYATDNYTLGRYGEVGLSRVPHLFIATNDTDPNDAPANGLSASGNSNGAAVSARTDLNNRSRLLLDDARDGQDPAPTPYLYSSPLGGRTLRLGDSVSDLTGILSYGFGAYRIRPLGIVVFTPTNPRPATPPAVGGNVKVVAMNVLNYFTTFGGANDRGADNAAELGRQRAKIVAALSAMDADIFGLMEVQNNGTAAGSALHDLLNSSAGLNAAQLAAGHATYSAITPPGNPFGTDAIQVALIYKSSRVTPVGAALTDTANAAAYNRPPLTQLFSVNATGGTFYVCVNHFKSKGATGATGADLDQNDGQSAFNARRKGQATALLSFLAGLQATEPDALVIGDLNAYGEEDPIDLFRAAGFIDEIGTRHPESEPYSFLFSGEVGRLDHVLASPSLHAQITDAAEWHINADEPVIIDYNTEFKTDDAYFANAFRASDHDPALVGLQIDTAPLTLTPNYGRPGTNVVLRGPNLGSASDVRFAGNLAATFTVDSASQLTATAPAGVVTGPVQVTTSSGVQSSEIFRVLPKITSFAPSSGTVGSTVTIIGAQLSGVTSVKFANDVAASFVVDSDTQIRATVPAGAVRGSLRVEASGGAATSLNRFTVTP